MILNESDLKWLIAESARLLDAIPKTGNVQPISHQKVRGNLIDFNEWKRKRDGV